MSGCDSKFLSGGGKSQNTWLLNCVYVPYKPVLPFHLLLLNSWTNTPTKWSGESQSVPAHSPWSQLPSPLVMDEDEVVVVVVVVLINKSAWSYSLNANISISIISCPEGEEHSKQKSYLCCSFSHHLQETVAVCDASSWIIHSGGDTPHLLYPVIFFKCLLLPADRSSVVSGWFSCHKDEVKFQQYGGEKKKRIADFYYGF